MIYKSSVAVCRTTGAEPVVRLMLPVTVGRKYLRVIVHMNFGDARPFAF